MYVVYVYLFVLLPGSSEPEGMAIHSIHGFVEELVVNDDPEYQVQCMYTVNIIIYNMVYIRTCCVGYTNSL